MNTGPKFFECASLGWIAVRQCQENRRKRTPPASCVDCAQAKLVDRGEQPTISEAEFLRRGRPEDPVEEQAAESPAEQSRAEAIAASDPSAAAALDLLRREGFASTAALAEAMGIPLESALQRLEHLAARGVLRSQRRGRGARWWIADGQALPPQGDIAFPPAGPVPQDGRGNFVVRRSQAGRALRHRIEHQPAVTSRYVDALRASLYMKARLLDSLPPWDEDWPEPVKEQWKRTAEFVLKEAER